MLSQAIELELLGHKDKALIIYTNILKRDSANAEAKLSIRRLSGMQNQFTNINQTKLDFFTKMQSKAEFLEFEKWLLKIQM